ncbi:DUF2007 domain-containing protein [uncultured Duncaniella sp.]|uniref:DUF2007 domain-containing protein n=1 Tax=uncultured Duncaniella sp. TaxID=2768039 RepID=UPI00262E8736|nr:DUF2007 domain-containing protein [uncultured Duncaniella sp.]
MSLLKRLKELLSDTRPPEPDDLVRISTYSNVEEASIAKGCLEANGIPAMVENTAEIYTPQIKQGVGVLVFYRDYAAACKLLGINME